MKPEISPLRVTVLDFFAAFLPGVVWLLLIVTAADVLAFGSAPSIPSPLRAAALLLGKPDAAGIEVRLGAELVVALALGYMLKSWTNAPAEYIAGLPEMLRSRWRDGNRSWKNLRFPYHGEHATKSYFSHLITLVKDVSGEEWHALPPKQPFSTCKRFLRLEAPVLWEEVERLEGEVRMLGSFFIASLFSATLAALSLATTAARLADIRAWLVVSLFTAAAAGGAFRAQRRREVELVYVNALIAHTILVRKTPS